MASELRAKVGKQLSLQGSGGGGGSVAAWEAWGTQRQSRPDLFWGHREGLDCSERGTWWRWNTKMLGSGHPGPWAFTRQELRSPWEALS